MKLTEQDIELITKVEAANRRFLFRRGILFVVMMMAIVLTFYGVVGLDYFAYLSVSIVFFTLLFPGFGLNIGAVADLLARLQSEADLPEKDELIESLSRKI